MSEDIQYCINKIDYILAYKFITPPVKTDLEDVKAKLEGVS
jgi:hypothetical protein|tara:strand:+ start:1153 stop:1275 length:123 start_codon:yes stop_codon:yes gene_type:complete